MMWMAMNVFIFLSFNCFFFTQLVVWAATKLVMIVKNVSFAHPIAEHPRKGLQIVIVKRDTTDYRMTHSN